MLWFDRGGCTPNGPCALHPRVSALVAEVLVDGCVLVPILLRHKQLLNLPPVPVIHRNTTNAKSHTSSAVTSGTSCIAISRSLTVQVHWLPFSQAEIPAVKLMPSR